MRRKVLQDHANTLCQMLVGWRMGEDVGTFGKLGKGKLVIDVLEGKATHNDNPVQGLYIDGELRAWFRDQLRKHAIAVNHIVTAYIIADMDVETQTTRKKIPKVHLQWDVVCRITTGEKTYIGRLKDALTWAGVL